MTDTQTPRPTLKLSLKPATLESLAGRIPQKTVIIPEKLETKSITANKKDETSNKKVSPQAPLADKPSAIPKTEQQQDPNKNKKPEPKAKKKEIVSPPVLQPYDFFEVYSKLHTDFREVISLKKPAALAIGIKNDIKEASGLSHKNTKMWISEYLRRSQYYKRGHIAGANRYNLQGEIVGVVTQEECNARQAMFKNFKRELKKAPQPPQETDQ